MKKSFSILLFTFVFIVVTQNAYSQEFPYHLYDTRTLSELVEINDEIEKVEGSKNMMISANPFYSAVRLEYMGESRKVSEEKMLLFKLWVESLGIKTSRNVDPLKVIDKEFLFKECGKEYWIPVQTPAANDFPDDLEKGDKITLYLMLVGGIENKEKWDIVFLTNSFKVY